MDRLVGHPRHSDLAPVHLTIEGRKQRSRLLAAPLIIVYLFAGLITIGTFLLMLPFAHKAEGFTPLLVAFFTATSATTVTGLAVQDTATYWTRHGQIVILAMIYVGGLGIMTLATFLIVLVGQRITIAQRLLVREILLIDQLGGLVRLAIGIVVVATIIQVIGFLVLFLRFYFLYPLDEALWLAVFHSISGFNGAGFVAFNESGQLMAFRHDIFVLSTITLLIVIGAISYLVIFDLVRYRKTSVLSLNTKLVLVFSGALTFIGTLLFLVLEYRNPETLGQLSFMDKIIDSVFQVNSGRTAGFSLFHLDTTNEYTNIFTAVFMLIGGASGSVSGGIKVNTFAIIVLSVIATLKGRDQANAFGREIPLDLVKKAMVIFTLSIGFVFLMVFLLGITEDQIPLSGLLFESISAFGTVGLTTGITPSISSIGQIILIIGMFIGKLGPLVVGISMVQRVDKKLFKFTEESVLIG